MEQLRGNITTSYVDRRLKTKKDKGSGEAKFHLGPASKTEEYDEFFNHFSGNNKYFFQKDNLLEHLNKTEIEYSGQKFNLYKEADLKHHKEMYEKIEAFDDEIEFELVSHVDKGRYYIRENLENLSEHRILNSVVRLIALPRITDLVISKNDNEYTFTLDLNHNFIQGQVMRKSEDKKLSHQQIFFGAPGTGKSYQLNLEAREYFNENYNRVTFHPNYMYSNFVGTFKPFPKYLKTSEGNFLKDDHGNIEETITYEYVPGIFIQTLLQAIKEPEQNFLLLIEEINRANVSAVFGDTFQLLDRNSSGESEYSINTAKELRDFLKIEMEEWSQDEEVIRLLGKDFDKLTLPKNFFIWSTMNSADQGVMPIDSAFRRRWDFTYIGIDDTADELQNEFESYYFKISENKFAKWDEYRRAINERLSNLNVSEDKLLGPYFISKSILESDDEDFVTDTVRNKVLMYLYEDAAKPFRREFFAEKKFSTFSQLCENFDENALSIFKNELDIEIYDA